MSTAALEYAPLPRGHRIRRARRIIFAVGFGVMLLVGIYYWPRIRRVAPQIYWERKSLNYRAPGGKIFYSNDPQDVAKLRSSSGYTTWSRGLGPGVYVIAPNDSFQKMVNAQTGGTSGAAPAIFLHGRKTPSGVTHLVAVQFTTMATADPLNGRFLSPYVHQMVFGPNAPGSKRSGQLEMCLAPTDRVRFYDGQPDPADQSAFTIDYDVNGRRGTIDGKLANDGTVMLTPRTGRFVVLGGNGWWSPTGAPMPLGVEEMLPAATTNRAR
jgi:hypothetical protein